MAGKPGRPGGIPGSRPPGGLVGWLVGGMSCCGVNFGNKMIHEMAKFQ